MLTENQINDQFKTQLGREATPYEVGVYSKASPLSLASLKDTYAKYNKDQSIVDYLKFTGTDPSTMRELASKYGISNVGTAEGNVKLLQLLKSGAVPKTPSVPGTVTPTDKMETPPAPTLDTPPGPTPPASEKPVQEDKPPRVAGIDETLNSYQEVQRKIADIDQSINEVIADRRKQIEQSGGIVNESQLKSLVLAEKAPLIDLRKSYVSQQSILGKQYTNLLAQQKESDTNFFKSKTEADKQTQLKQAEEKITNQEEQFRQKFEQAGWKLSKVNITDAAGNVLGQRLVWSHNPSDPSVPVYNSSQFAPTSSGNGGIKNGVTNLGNNQPIPKLTIADGASPEQVLQSLISGPVVPVKGSTIPLTQQDLYNLAIQDMLGVTSTVGGRTPSGAILAVKHKETEIMNAYGLTAFDISIAKQEVKGLTAANTQLLAQAAFTKTYASTANDNLQLALDQSDKVARSGAKIENKYKQWIQGNFTPAGDLAEFETYIYTASREYAKVTSGGARSAQGLTDSAQKEVEKLINASQSPEVFKKVVQAMQNDMNNVIKNFDKSTVAFPESIKKMYGLAAGPSAPSTTKSGKPFDYQAAKDAGYTEQEIQDFINSN